MSACGYNWQAVYAKEYLCSIEEICVELGWSQELQQVNNELLSNLIPTLVHTASPGFEANRMQVMLLSEYVLQIS